MTALVVVALLVLVGVVTWRPHGTGPMLGALAALVLVLASGAATLTDVRAAAEAQWRAFLSLVSIMVMAAAAERVGLLARVAAWIEPRTRGPVKHAFRLTFVAGALTSTVLSNDAAILLVTPVVIVLLRTVYPRRHGKFLAAFAFAVFASAGVAPLVISNPMNLIFAEHAGITFNAYARTMIPVALASWGATYAVLAWWFRAELADEAPALGAWPEAVAPLGAAAKVVLAILGCELALYPIATALDVPLWGISVAGGAACSLAALADGHRAGDLARGIAWPVFPFLVAVFVIAIALDRVGAVAGLRALYADATAPIATVGVVTAAGSALLNNHPMSVLDALALADARDPALAYAALVGGDLGPRLLPIGSLASLLWFDVLRKHAVELRVSAFIRLGAALTVPALAAALGALALMTLVSR